MRSPSWCLVVVLFSLCQADFSDQCPKEYCTCKWANGKREADCTKGGLTGVPMQLHHEIQILRMTGNYVTRLSREVFKSAGLLNLQRIFMNGCSIQVSSRCLGQYALILGLVYTT